MSKEIVAPQIKEVILSTIVEDLKNGLTKWKKDDIGFGSIEKKSYLFANVAHRIDRHPKLIGLATSNANCNIIDQLAEDRAKWIAGKVRIRGLAAQNVVSVDPIDHPGR